MPNSERHAGGVDGGRGGRPARGRREHQHGTEHERHEERPLVRDAAQARLRPAAASTAPVEVVRWFDRGPPSADQRHRGRRHSRQAAYQRPHDRPVGAHQDGLKRAGACSSIITSQPRAGGPHRVHHRSGPTLPRPGAPGPHLAVTTAGTGTTPRRRRGSSRSSAHLRLSEPPRAAHVRRPFVPALGARQQGPCIGRRGRRASRVREHAAVTRPGARRAQPPGSGRASVTLAIAVWIAASTFRRQRHRGSSAVRRTAATVAAVVPVDELAQRGVAGPIAHRGDSAVTVSSTDTPPAPSRAPAPPRRSAVLADRRRSTRRTARPPRRRAAGRQRVDTASPRLVGDGFAMSRAGGQEDLLAHHEAVLAECRPGRGEVDDRLAAAGERGEPRPIPCAPPRSRPDTGALEVVGWRLGYFESTRITPRRRSASAARWVPRRRAKTAPSCASRRRVEQLVHVRPRPVRAARPCRSKPTSAAPASTSVGTSDGASSRPTSPKDQLAGRSSRPRTCRRPARSRRSSGSRRARRGAARRW